MTLILASASPRRRELLSAMGLRFDVRTSDVEESAAMLLVHDGWKTVLCKDLLLRRLPVEQHAHAFEPCPRCNSCCGSRPVR